MYIYRSLWWRSLPSQMNLSLFSRFCFPRSMDHYDPILTMSKEWSLLLWRSVAAAAEDQYNNWDTLKGAARRKQQIVFCPSARAVDHQRSCWSLDWGSCVLSGDNRTIKYFAAWDPHSGCEEINHLFIHLICYPPILATGHFFASFIFNCILTLKTLSQSELRTRGG